MRKFIIFCFCSFLILGCNKVDRNSKNYYKNFTYIKDVKKAENKYSGINLGNALDAPAEGEWGIILQEEYFKVIKDAGFKYLRIPIRWSKHTEQIKPYIINPRFMKRVDWAVNLALLNKLTTIINIHHFIEIMTDPDENKQKFFELWKQIAEHYKDMPQSLYFELLNEPCNNMDSKIWNEYLSEAIKIVRNSGGNNTTRILIIGPVYYNRIEKLDEMAIPEYSEDPNIIVTIHYYEPMKFSHQGCSWLKDSTSWLGTKWTGKTSEKKAVKVAFDKAKKWADIHKRKLLLGEFGTYEKVDLDSRVLYTEFIAREAEKRDMIWTYWEFCSTFGIYHSGKKAYRKELLNALNP